MVHSKSKWSWDWRMFKLCMILVVKAQSLPSKYPHRLFSLEPALLLKRFEDVDEGMIKGYNSFGWPLDNFVLFGSLNLQRALSRDILFPEGKMFVSFLGCPTASLLCPRVCACSAGDIFWVSYSMLFLDVWLKSTVQSHWLKCCSSQLLCVTSWRR